MSSMEERWKEAQDSKFCETHNSPRLDCGDETSYCNHCLNAHVVLFGRYAVDLFKVKLEESPFRVEFLTSWQEALRMSRALDEHPDVTLARMIFGRAQRFGQMGDQVIEDICTLGLEATEIHPSKRK